MDQLKREDDVRDLRAASRVKEDKAGVMAALLRDFDHFTAETMVAGDKDATGRENMCDVGRVLGEEQPRLASSLYIDQRSAQRSNQDLAAAVRVKIEPGDAH
jgi:hypothetical protein